MDADAFLVKERRFSAAANTAMASAMVAAAAACSKALLGRRAPFERAPNCWSAPEKRTPPQDFCGGVGGVSRVVWRATLVGERRLSADADAAMAVAMVAAAAAGSKNLLDW